MHLLLRLPVLVLFFQIVLATPSLTTGVSRYPMDRAHFFGCGPIPPWKPGCTPGWYYGSQCPSLLGLPCLGNLIGCLLFTLLGLQCPSSPTSTAPPNPSGTPGSVPGFDLIFGGHNGSVQASDYMTFGLVSTVADCVSMCKTIAGGSKSSTTDAPCTFFNTYHDVHGKNDSPLLTCALFAKCHKIVDANNYGQQDQLNTSVLNFIRDSAGYCAK